MKGDTLGPSHGQSKLPGARDTLAELALPTSTADRSRVRVAVATAEALRPQTHARLVLKGQEDHSAENVLLRGLHYMDVVAAGLNETAQNIAEVNGDNIKEVIATVKPYMAVLSDLQEGLGILVDLVTQDKGEQVLRSQRIAKALFGEKKAVTQFVEAYNFEDEGINASSLVAAFLEERFTQQVRQKIGYCEALPQEVMVDSFGVDRLLQPLDNLHQNVAKIFRTTSPTEGANPLGHENEEYKKKRKNELYSLLVHDWRTPITSLKGFLQLAEGRISSKPDSETAIRFMNRFISLVPALEDMRQHMYDALQNMFDPAEVSLDLVKIPLDQWVKDTQRQLRFWLGDRALFGNLELPEGAIVSIPQSILKGLVRNVVQNATRSLHAGFLLQGMKGDEAWELATNQVKISLSAKGSEKVVRIRFSDASNGITDGRRGMRFAQGDSGYGIDGVGSTGLVMPILSRELKDIGGEMVLVKNPSGRGATLVVKLPLTSIGQVAEQ